MREIIIHTYPYFHGEICRAWKAEYEILGAGDVRALRLETRWSSREVIVAKFDHHDGLGNRYYISLPGDEVAIRGIYSLRESEWIIDHLIDAGLVPVDAITVAYVLRNVGDF